MTFDEYLAAHEAGKTKIFRATGVSIPTLRKVEQRLPVSGNTAIKLAEFLGCDYKLFTQPRPRPAARKRGRAK